MNITDVSENTYFFKEMRGGDVFKDRNGGYYVRLFVLLNDHEVNSNAVRLSDGTGAWIKDDEEVKKASRCTLEFSD